MKRLALQLVIGMFTFGIGAGFHQTVLRLVDEALSYPAVVLQEPASCATDSSEVEQAFFDMCCIVVSLADRRDVYLGKQFVGNPDDTSRLEARLQSKFAEFEQAPMDVHPKELSEPIRIHPICMKVYIRASINSSYEDVVRLIEAAKRAGAHHIGLVADKRKKGGR